MILYFLKRILYLVPTLLIVVLSVFLLIHLIPGDPVALMLGDRAKPEDVVMIKKQLGLDKPLMIQFGIWLGRVCRGDFGTSIKSRRPSSNPSRRGSRSPSA